MGFLSVPLLYYRPTSNLPLARSNSFDRFTYLNNIPIRTVNSACSGTLRSHNLLCANCPLTVFHFGCLIPCFVCVLQEQALKEITSTLEATSNKINDLEKSVKSQEEKVQEKQLELDEVKGEPFSIGRDFWCFLHVYQSQVAQLVIRWHTFAKVAKIVAYLQWVWFYFG